MLRLTGASVMAVSADQATHVLRREHFDLVVFCHTVSPQDLEKVVLEARKRHVGVRVLNVLRFAESCAAPEATVSEPTRLFLKATDALEKTLRNQQRGASALQQKMWRTRAVLAITAAVMIVTTSSD